MLRVLDKDKTIEGWANIYREEGKYSWELSCFLYQFHEAAMEGADAKYPPIGGRPLRVRIEILDQ